MGSNTVSDFRMILAARGLNRAGYNAEVELVSIPFYHIALHDLFVIARPNAAICTLADAIVESGRPLIIDMDDDFTRIPPHSPAYNVIGPGAPGGPNNAVGGYLRILDATIKQATGFTTPSEVVASRYQRLDYKLVENTFDDECIYWHAPSKSPRDMISIGWVGTATHMKDLTIAMPALRRILAERPDVRIVIGGDPDIYRMFSSVPEKQKLFIPGMAYADYPCMYNYFDIAIAPLEDTPFTRAKSNIKLIETGARGIPWVASALPQYKAYGAGGILVEKPDDWYGHLMTLIESPAVRREMGQAGRELAWSKYSSTCHGERWVDVVKGFI